MIPLRRALSSTVIALTEAGISSPEAEALTLVSFVTGVEPSRLVLLDTLSSEQEARLTEAIEARLSGVPLQHITGRAYFRTISVRVGPGVFIPRPETEVLAGWAIDQVINAVTRVVELCAGSGAISLSIARESSPAEQWAVEMSTQALSYLVENLGNTAIAVVEGDMATALGEMNGTIDVVVANPPYIPQRTVVPPDVTQDPAGALYSGTDGLDATRIVAEVAMRLLRAGGVVGSEHGDDQAEEVRRIFLNAGFTDVETHPDVNSRPRFVTARKPDME